MSQVFQVTEEAVLGLPVVMRGRPHIATPPGCPPVTLDASVESLIRRGVQNQSVRYGVSLQPVYDPAGGWLGYKKVPGHMIVEARDQQIVLGPCVGQPLDNKAFVHVATYAGVGGKIWALGDSYGHVETRRGVERRYHPFPTLGIEPCCTPDILAAMQAGRGVEFMDFFMWMREGASCYLQRTGRLEGAASRLAIRWSRGRLTVQPSGGYARGATAARAEAFA